MSLRLKLDELVFRTYLIRNNIKYLHSLKYISKGAYDKIGYQIHIIFINNKNKKVIKLPYLHLDAILPTLDPGPEEIYFFSTLDNLKQYEFCDKFYNKTWTILK